MRIHLAGAIAKGSPVFVLFTADGTFDKTAYPEYTNYDVIAIGGGGGRGGGCAGTDTNSDDVHIRNYGGAGGGGGFHRVQGLLEVLDDSIDVVIGTAGANGLDNVSPSVTEDGEDGTVSSFGDFCLASGGKGGKRSVSCSIIENMECDGGEGGLGGQSEAGHGAQGGLSGIVDPGNTPGTRGVDGILHIGPFEFVTATYTLAGLVGEGGGGGAGGIASSGDPYTTWSGHLPWATNGGKGSYDSDEAVFGPGGFPFLDPDHHMAIGPGSGGGARLTPLNRSTKQYGSSSQDGIVAIRLTKE